MILNQGMFSFSGGPGDVRCFFGPFRPGTLVRGLKGNCYHESSGGTPVNIAVFDQLPPDTPDGFSTGVQLVKTNSLSPTFQNLPAIYLRGQPLDVPLNFVVERAFYLGIQTDGSLSNLNYTFSVDVMQPETK